MISTSTASMIRGAARRFMLLLLPGWSHWGHIATLKVEERQDRRRLLSIEHIHLFHCRKEFAHRLQIEAATRHLRRLPILCQESVEARHVHLGRLGASDRIPLRVGNGALSLPTRTGHFLVEGLHRLVGLT